MKINLVKKTFFKNFLMVHYFKLDHSNTIVKVTYNQEVIEEICIL